MLSTLQILDFWTLSDDELWLEIEACKSALMYLSDLQMEHPDRDFSSNRAEVEQRLNALNAVDQSRATQGA